MIRKTFTVPGEPGVWCFGCGNDGWNSVWEAVWTCRACSSSSAGMLGAYIDEFPFNQRSDTFILSFLCCDALLSWEEVSISKSFQDVARLFFCSVGSVCCFAVHYFVIRTPVGLGVRAVWFSESIWSDGLRGWCEPPVIVFSL